MARVARAARPRRSRPLHVLRPAAIDRSDRDRSDEQAADQFRVDPRLDLAPIYRSFEDHRQITALDCPEPRIEHLA
jgi:hypothetical protein